MTRTWPLLVLLLCALASASATAQPATGVVTGTVFDQKSGEALIGANVLLVGTALGGSADLDGRFTIRNVPAGSYDLRVSYIGYAAKVVKGLNVRAGETAKIDVVLAEAQLEKAKEEVVITAERVLATEAAVLSERKKAATIGDAVSAEQIRRSPDATSGDALKRVTGVTVVDNKFVFIRGVTDRYNGTSLNGVSVSSTDTDVDRKSFSFDLVPANLLENTTVVKTATPDLPGDFSGGLVQVNTLDFPSTRTARIALSGGFDSRTSTRSMIASPGGGRDWLARDDGSREFPGGGKTGAALAQALPNDWVARDRKAPLNHGLNLSYGDRLGLGTDELGYVAALSYRSGYQTSDFHQSPSSDGVPFFDLSGSRYKRDVLWGGLLNVSAKLGGLHKISFRNNYNQTADDQVATSHGIASSADYVEKQVIQWTQRSFGLTQLSGEHQFPVLAGLKVGWKVHYSESHADEPDRKEVEYARDAYGHPYMRDNYRTWSALNEIARGANVDFSLSVNGTKLKAGLGRDLRGRAYSIDAWSTVIPPAGLASAYAGLPLLPLDQIFAGENYGPGKFRFIPITVFTGEYAGRNSLNSAYAMFDRQLTLFRQPLRFVGGARLEDSRITIRSIKELGGAAVSNRLANTDWLPSANLTWLVRENANVRLAYGRSVNRPEFRELANVLYYDFNAEQDVYGNSALKRATIDNYDARLEFFPHVGEVLAGSFFYKDIHDAIEENLKPAPERYARSWFNSPKGRNYGWELEVRKSLGFLTSALRNFSVTGNYTRVLSAIYYTYTHTDDQGNRVDDTLHRVMQGQAPWTANVSLLFVAPRSGTSVNVLYGEAGRRLSAVGDTRDQDVYEESRELLDVAITQRLFTRWEAKFTGRNLLGMDESFTTGPERSNFEHRTRGPVWSLQMALGL